MDSKQLIELEDLFGAHNYHPLDVVAERAEGSWLYDVDGKRYLDCLSAYSAVNQGHCHPKIISALVEQAQKVTLTSRAFRNTQLPLFYKELCELCEMEMALAMNTGAEAVESALKIVRKWGYQVKGIAQDKAEIIVCTNNFHGRTISIVGFSSEEKYKEGFGPFTPGFREIPYGNFDALAGAINENTCAFLVEPVQGEGGIVFPPDGFFEKAAQKCRDENVLLVLDEIQCGLGRTGKMFAYEHEGIKPNVLILGKALSGGVTPVSAVVADRAVMEVLTPGDHGSTFGGNPLGCAAARAAIKVLVDEDLVNRAASMGASFVEQLRTLKHPSIVEVRGRGMMIGIELD
ncbi:UNVERIFIED_CONTAM: hypothetical protein GTU68_027076, partial [Idotea baltica]|nr:hypothetical protein [Idotea baltica]